MLAATLQVHSAGGWFVFGCGILGTLLAGLGVVTRDAGGRAPGLLEGLGAALFPALLVLILVVEPVLLAIYYYRGSVVGTAVAGVYLAACAWYGGAWFYQRQLDARYYRKLELDAYLKTLAEEDQEPSV
jgi:hypothetical protein